MSVADGEAAAPRRSRRLTIWLVIGGVVLALVAAAAWVGIRGLMVKDELERLLPVAGQVRGAAEIGDIAALRSSVDELADGSARAAGLTSDPVWRVAEWIPGVGVNLTAVRLTSRTLDEVAQPASELLTTLAAAEATTSEGLDVGLLRSISGPVVSLADALERGQTDMADVDPEMLIPQLRSGFSELTRIVGDAAPVAGTAASAVSVLPGMLGEDGPRSILLMLQNNAELRTGGGITGTFALLHADAGDIAMGELVDSSRFQPTVEPILPVPESTVELYGETVGTYVQNTSMTPDFALTADLAREWWSTVSDEVPDAVVSIDPTVIAALLAATGPVTLDDGSQLTTDNAVERLLIEPYLTYDVEEQTAYQRELTGRIVEHVLSTPVDVMTWMQVLLGPIEEGRISAWSAIADEQDSLDDGPLGGPVSRHAQAGDNSFAVYLNDATAGKMGSLLDVTFSAGTISCRSDGLIETVIGVDLGSRVTPEMAAELPWWITGGGIVGVPIGDIATNVTVAGPADAFAGGVTVDGERVVSTDVEDNGFPSSAARMTVSPGETLHAEFRFVHEAASDDLHVLHTPLFGDAQYEALSPTCG